MEDFELWLFVLGLPVGSLLAFGGIALFERLFPRTFWKIWPH